MAPGVTNCQASREPASLSTGSDSAGCGTRDLQARPRCSLRATEDVRFLEQRPCQVGGAGGGVLFVGGPSGRIFAPRQWIGKPQLAERSALGSARSDADSAAGAILLYFTESNREIL